MTRTERSFSPRAVIRDRSESKSGLDKSSRKGGAGAHNWGSYADEQDHEYRALEDYEDEGLAAAEDVKEELAADVSKASHDGSLTERRSSVVSEQERQQAREFRAKALKDGSDLGAIARTSAAVSSSPPGKASTVTVTTDAETGVPI
ncbi:hypothetical protein JB92DRAFT_3126148 [Gautieria morchelliformis]|nr:hypothetical protein JB92DRAFT_3126148 [Gautieria morchelliformis]